jgi:ABC-2 type transport system ATP-binding protein
LQADTLEMMRYYRGIYPSFDDTTFYRMQEFFSNIDMKRNIRRLSKGMQKQVAFWLAISCHPKLIVLDEPLDGLDPVMRRQIWTILMAEVAERNTTVLVASHNLRELEDVCDHVGIMNNGKIILECSLMELQSSISKIQVACQSGMPKLPKDFEVLHMSNIGRVYTMIVKGNSQEAVRAIRTESDHLAIVDILPLTLEEIFIYEMGGLGYEVKDILF